MKRHLTIRVLLQTSTFLLTAMLVAVLATYAGGAVRSERQARRVPAIVDISNDLFSAIQAIRVQRANIHPSLMRQMPADSETRRVIAAQRIEFEKSLDRALKKLPEARVQGAAANIGAIRDSVVAYDALRHDVDAAILLPRDERPAGVDEKWLSANRRLVDAIDSLSSQLENELSQTDPFIANMIQIKQMTWVVRSDSGDDRLLMREVMANDSPLSEEQLRQFAILEGRMAGNWKLVQAKARLTSTPAKLKAAIDVVDRDYFDIYLPLRKIIIDDLTGRRPAGVKAADFQKLTLAGQRSIFAVATTAFELSRAHAAAQLDAARRNFYAAMTLMMLCSTAGLLTVLYVIKGVVLPIRKITESMSSVAEGHLDRAIPYEERHDEIGSLARSLRVFKGNALDKLHLQIAKEGAEAANRTKSLFLAKMSHELRTPLNAIIGFSEIIKNQMFGAGDYRYRDYSGDIFKSGVHLLEVINNILDISRMEAGQMEMHEETVNLRKVVEDCFRFVALQAEESGLQLSASFPDNLPLVRADERRLAQILLNLLSNAVKFTPKGGKIRVTVFRRQGELAIAVSDSGIGMAPEEIPKALTAFVQIDNAFSRQYNGTGLGLAISKGLAELHGGRLAIESTPGCGTTVALLLPPDRVFGKTAPPVETPRLECVN